MKQPFYTPEPAALRRSPQLASLAVLDVILDTARIAMRIHDDEDDDPPPLFSFEGYVRNDVCEHIDLLRSALKTYRTMLERCQYAAPNDDLF